MKKGILLKKISRVIKNNRANKWDLLSYLKICHNLGYIELINPNGTFPHFYLENMTNEELKELLKISFLTAEWGKSKKNIVFNDFGQYNVYLSLKK